MMLRRSNGCGAVIGLLLATAGMAHAQGPGDPARALVAAVQAGDRAGVEQMVRAKVPVDARDEQGRTALLVAVDLDRTDIARTLMAAGASINAQAANLDTPWLLAGARGRTEIIREMIPLGPDLAIRNRFGGNALIPACERGYVETIKVLLTTAIPVDHVNNLGWTCLLEIVILGDGGPRHVEATRLVLAAGADPNLADRNGVTPLAHARSRNQAEVAKLIEAAGGRMQR
jgi:ankyrin repeat protein